MKLRDVLKDIETVIFIDNLPDVDIDRIENDSREAKAGSLFIAASGYVEDSHPYVDSAYRNGCRHAVVDIERCKDLQDKYPEMCFIPVRDIHAALATISSNYFQNPSSKMKLIGITGTSGKTTTAFAVFGALRAMGKKAGMVGTIEYRINEEVIPATNTTPDILFLNRLMADMVSKGLEYMVMEVSSHSLILGRVAGLHFDVGAFTNFSQDHLDFHKTMEEYFEAKLKIFDLLDSSAKQKRSLIVNEDMEGFADIKKRAALYPRIHFKTISVKGLPADYSASGIQLTPFGSSFQVNGSPVQIDMIGITNVYNVTLASAILQELGFKETEISGFMKELRVPGRMETVPNNKEIAVVIDYAHKPDALEKLLQTVRGVLDTHGKIVAVIGAGGDRDRLKRPVMGRLAAKYSDNIIITSDNPRTEDPMQIIREIEAGVKETGFLQYTIEENRAAAIHLALQSARKGDCVVIAGKGHENYQEINKVKHHFSDREEVLRFFDGGSN